jgi:hypothetical protein
MNTSDKVAILSTLCTRDSAGRHFTAKFSGDDLAALETEELIVVTRPIHEATGLPYSEEYYSVEVTEAGVELVEAYPEDCVAE